MQTLTELEIEERLKRVLNRTTHFPTEDFLQRFPHGRLLVEAARPFGGIGYFYDKFGRQTYFESITVPIPSAEQRLGGIEIALTGMEDKKRFELSEAGTRKTIKVLSAIPVINEVLMPQLGHPGEKVKVLTCCPTYVLPTWIREAERIFHDPNIVVVTRQNRKYALRRAAQRDVDLVLLGYELSHRKTGVDFRDQEIKDFIQERTTELRLTVFDEDAAYNLLERVMLPKKFKKYRKGKRSIDKIIERVVVEEMNARVASIATDLQQNAFPTDGPPYYVIYDEIHNIIDPHSATAQALSGLFKAAKWGALVTGTGIRNKLSNLAYLAYLDGRIEDPDDFPDVFRDNPKIISSMFDLDANAIRRLEDVDDEIPPPEYTIIEYNLSSEEMDLYIDIANSPIFEGKDQYLLLNYLLTNPAKLLPENFAKKESEDSLRKKVEQFFDEHPKYTSLCENITSSKVAVVKKEIDAAKEAGRKVVIACEFSSNLTTFLEEEFAEYGCVRIDQNVSAQIKSPKLTAEEIQHLQDQELYDQQKLRCDLSLPARVSLGIDNHAIYEPSERQLALLEFQTNPDKPILVTTYGTLREGTDVQEASVLVEYECATVPFKFSQMLARLRRSGQREVVEVVQPKARRTIEEAKYEFRDWKQYIIDLVFKGKGATPEELEEFMKDTQVDKSTQVGNMLKLNARDTVALMFDHLRGAGVDKFVAEMQFRDNALFLAKNYNYEWQNSFSANCARLINELVLGIENKIGRGLEDILDEGCGPTTVARKINRDNVERRVVSIDVNKYQMDYGIDACNEAGIENNRYFLGSYTNLGNLIELTPEVNIFDPQATYENTAGIDERSQDLAVCSLALDFATEEERKQFFRENKKALRRGGYLMIVNPTSKIDKSCRKDFLKDVEDCGFKVDRDLTGTYKSRKSVNMDTMKEQKNAFEAYVVIAQKTDDEEIEFQDSRTYFQMAPTFKVTEGEKNGGNGKGKGGKIKRFRCNDFYNHDTGVDPKRLEPSVGSLPIHEDLTKKIYSAIEETSEEELNALAEALNQL